MRTDNRLRQTPLKRRGLVVSGLTCLLLSHGACGFHPPESAVHCAESAAAQGDRDAYASCFTPRSRAFLAAYWHAVGQRRPELLGLGAGAVEILEVGPVGGRGLVAERAYVQVREGPRQYRLVVHQTGGRWRIDLWDTRQSQYGIRGI